MSPQQRNSTAQQGVRQLIMLNLQVLELCYLPEGHNSDVTNHRGVHTDQHHAAQ